ncbi:PE-PPE domain-containing protein [[Mycobacterium] kokjensenii]|uniref:PE-PPE domain-containing protein n=1 Tax=[Mycobacterium] kokjensenii TaxID=3064287 RepID=A0ABM9LA64_9MYCO|nr:PE-PPE domain-containing protein [Mycolicibacter sp. MU0083]CAJ1495534.1 PE-PPE domain-containing protein [Mycolicibacter sp. MU0083]
MEAISDLFLKPHGFTGDLYSQWGPENRSATSSSVGLAELQNSIATLLNGDKLEGYEDSPAVSAENPIVVFGYSQSGGIASRLVEWLEDNNVSNELVRIVTIGSMAAARVDLGAYHTDVYNYEYDSVGVKPIYNNPLAELNSSLGFIYGHSIYASATPEQIENAVELSVGDPDSLTTFHMIENDLLPLLAPVQLIPILGMPLYELLEPATRVLVNLGYGSLEHGWPPGNIDEVTPSDSFLPPNIEFGDLLEALGKAVLEGIGNSFMSWLDPETYHIYGLNDHPSLLGIINEGYLAGYLDSPTPTLEESLTGLSAFLAAFQDTTEYEMPEPVELLPIDIDADV